jgi:hypothetical protein
MAAASGHPFVQEKRKKLATQLSGGGSNRPPARPAFAWAAQTSLPVERVLIGRSVTDLACLCLGRPD